MGEESTFPMAEGWMAIPAWSSCHVSFFFLDRFHPVMSMAANREYSLLKVGIAPFVLGKRRDISFKLFNMGLLGRECLGVHF